MFLKRLKKFNKEVTTRESNLMGEDNLPKSINEKAMYLIKMSEYIKFDFQLGTKCLFLYKNKSTGEYIYLVQKRIPETNESIVYYAIHRGSYFDIVNDIPSLDIDQIKAVILKKLNDRMENLDKRKEVVLEASVNLISM